MKTLSAKAKISGFTLIELLVVLSVIFMSAAVILPTLNHPHKAKSPLCVTNQKQIAIAFIMFADDNGGKFPWQVSTTNNGSLELVSNGLASAQYLPVETYLGNRPQVLLCPADKAREEATNFSTLANTNISYFLNLDAITNMNSILTGDRNLEFMWRPINPGIFTQTTNTMLKWIAGFHRAQDKPYGAISFADGHVKFVRQEDLNRTLQNQPLATNRFCFP